MSAIVKYVGKRIEGASKRNEVTTESPYFTAEHVKLFKPMFGFLNDKDRDILYLIFVSKKKQKEVQKILNRIQPSLCYDIKRIRRRLKFIVYLYSVFDIFINFICEEDRKRRELDISEDDISNKNRRFFTETELAILTLMFYTSSFTLTAKKLGISQVRVRYTYNKCLGRMEDMQIWEPYEIFMVIRSNLNIIKRIYASGDGGIPLPL